MPRNPSHTPLSSIPSSHALAPDKHSSGFCPYRCAFSRRANRWDPKECSLAAWVFGFAERFGNACVCLLDQRSAPFSPWNGVDQPPFTRWAFWLG